jgi:hypothetical protein
MTEITWNDEPETFHLMSATFDVRAAKKCLRETPHGVGNLPLAGLEKSVRRPEPDKIFFGGIAVDWEKVDNDPSIDLSVPVILATLSETHYPIDGWHRIAKAISLGLESLPCVVLSREETFQVSNLDRPKPATKNPVKKPRRKAS